ncbi:NlpC/P60 family protein [Streptomyces sp. NPDC101118]|uniref:C40 family peptidase n=1 Tax=Streptomyces sp. NPDC101118 TaxID=3366109 RepID=UPI0038248D31
MRTTAPALGASAALASVGLLAQTAAAAPAVPGPRPSVEEVRRQVDGLYRQAGAATQRYDAAKERTDAQRAAADAVMERVARNAQRLNEARRRLGSLAAARYRSGGLGDTATLLLADDPQAYFAQQHLLARLGGEERDALAGLAARQAAASRERAEAAERLAELSASQTELRRRKAEVQAKLAAARGLLARLTAEERARLAELERAEEARRRADAQRAAARREAEAQRERRDPGTPAPTPSTRGARAVAFARAQLGKPYVWGATGPASYDCSGLTQAAWRAAGVDLPRTTWEQVEAGPRIATADLVPGDLVFFYDDISHVGLYIGGGRMIHAPRPGAYIREDSIHYQPMYGRVRPS